MKKEYRIGRKTERLTSQEISRYKDLGKLMYNYQKASAVLKRKPLYKDPRTFFALLLIVLLALLLSGSLEEGGKVEVPPTDQELRSP